MSEKVKHERCVHAAQHACFGCW